jgi:hypothetical protein
VEHLSEMEIFAIANQIVDNLMDASTAIDHDRHIRDLTDRMKSIVTKAGLQKVYEKYQRENHSVDNSPRQPSGPLFILCGDSQRAIRLRRSIRTMRLCP